jgi:hypothetical protein
MQSKMPLNNFIFRIEREKSEKLLIVPHNKNKCFICNLMVMAVNKASFAYNG